MSAHLKKRLEKYRHTLIDKGLRLNALLHFSDETHSLFIKNTQSELLYDALISSTHFFKFLSLEEKQGAFHHLRKEKSLETELTKEQLAVKLSKIQARAKLIKQEQGLDVLYLAIGFVTWYEADDLQTPRCAPLLLIPVYLESDGASFKLAYLNMKINSNVVLQAKLAHDFNLFLPELAADSSDKSVLKINLNTYFTALEQALSHQRGWELKRDKIALGFFSFTNFGLYNDLSDEVWPSKNKPSAHPLLEKLWVTGFEEDGVILDKIKTEQYTDAKLSSVLPADPSQINAIKAAKAGASFIIQGPPGTGKSQTIANLIAQALADNKKVLFVTEKKTALEIVEQRLIHCKLGEALLELHSHKTNKKKLLSLLEKALFESATDAYKTHDESLVFNGDFSQLKAYENAIKAPIGKLTLSFYSAFNRTLYYKKALIEKGIKLTELPKTNFLLSKWDEKHYQEASSLMHEMSNFIDAYSDAFKSPFSSTKLLSYSPALEPKVNTYLEKLADSYSELLQLITPFLKQVIKPPEKAFDIKLEQDYRLILFLQRRPVKANWDLLLKLSATKCMFFLALAEKGVKLASEEKRLKALFFTPALTKDWYKIRGIFIRANFKGYRRWRFLSPRFHWASRQYASFRKKKEPVNLPHCLEEIDLLIEYQLNKEALSQALQPYRAIFETESETVLGIKTDSEKINWEENLLVFSWLKQYHKFIKDKTLIPLSPSFFDKKITDYFSVQERGRLISLFNTQQKALSQLVKTLKLDKAEFSAYLYSKTKQLDLNLEIVSKRMPTALYALCRFNRLVKKLTQAGLTDWAFLARHWSKSGEELNQAFQYVFYQALCEKTYQSQPALCHFDRVAHEACLVELLNKEKQLLEYSQQKIRKKINSSLPNPYAQGQMAALRRAFSQKKQAFSIRALFKQAGRAIQAIKPVFMMSPLSIAHYLAPGALEFDLVIFDEASQIKATEGLGALLRAKQAILVGDPEQLAPSQFFKSSRHLSLPMKSEYCFDENLTDGAESLLDLFLVNGAPRCLLQWHYRSEHPSLIKVPNQAFYRSELIYFPASGTNIKATGLELCYLPNTHYDKGKSRTNQEEALMIAKAVIAHAKENSAQSLGVITFSQAQRDEILSKIKCLRDFHPDCDAFFDANFSKAAFFVKNLEQVQGDERDVIFISIGYGKTQEGKLSSQFGPLNLDGGERRLNVLITRARFKMRVFTNFKSKDLNLTQTSSKGVQVLKQFLAYAENKRIDTEPKCLDTKSRKENNSHIDTDKKVAKLEKGLIPAHFLKTLVLFELKQLGYLIDTECEYAGVDIGVRDPIHSKRYLLAICFDIVNEADNSLQQQNRQRIEVLKNRGWHIHRIWCVDWFRHPQNELLRLTKAIDERLNYFNNSNKLNKNTEFEL